MSRQENDMPGTSTRGARIDVGREQEVERWAKKLDATPQQVRDAVEAVGDRPEDVEVHLKGVRSTTNSDTPDRAGG
jgi:hypothetical protein